MIGARPELKHGWGVLKHLGGRHRRRVCMAAGGLVTWLAGCASYGGGASSGVRLVAAAVWLLLAMKVGAGVESSKEGWPPFRILFFWATKLNRICKRV